MTICDTHRTLFTKDFLKYVAKKTCNHPDHSTSKTSSKSLTKVSFDIALGSIRLCNKLLPYGAPICLNHEFQAKDDIAKKEEPISQELCIIGQIPSSQSSLWSGEHGKDDDMDYEDEKPKSDPPDVAALKDFLSESGQKAELPHVLEKDFDLCDDSTKRKFLKFYAAAVHGVASTITSTPENQIKMWLELLKSKRVEAKLATNEPMPKEVESIMDVYNNCPHYLVRRQLIAFLIELGYTYDQLKKWNAKSRHQKMDVSEDGGISDSESEPDVEYDEPPGYQEATNQKVWTPYLSRYHFNKAKIHLLRTAHGLNPIYKEVKVILYA